MIKSGQLFVLITLPCFHFPNPYIAENTHWRMQKFFIREGEALTAIREGLLQSFPKLPTKFSPLYASDTHDWICSSAASLTSTVSCMWICWWEYLFFSDMVGFLFQKSQSRLSFQDQECCSETIIIKFPDIV